MLKALKRDYVSHSAISTYQQCPLRYYFRYVANLPEELTSSALVFGSGIHRAAELHFQVIDLKTSRSRWKSGQAENQAEQLLLYSELAKEMAPDKKLRLRFAVISKTKTPSLEMHDVSIHPDRVERTKRVVQRVWKAIQQGTFYPSPSPMKCPSCAYQQACRDWQG